MAEGVTSVRLGDLLAAVDREAQKDRRNRSDTIRLLVEEGLLLRQSGHFRQGSYLEFFDCPAPPRDVGYQVIEDEWDLDAVPPVRRVKRIRIKEET